jgi:adenylate kinase
VIVLLFGPPGGGKGTQATSIAARFGIPAISTGDVFRAEVKAGTELGKLASQIMASGGLVGDDIVNGIIANRITQPDCAHGFLLDGYPRTVPQAEFLAGVLRRHGLPEPVIVNLEVPASALVARLTARRQCPTCKRIYNLLSQPPRVEGKCDDDGAALITREDDKEEVIRRRLAAFDEQTGPILKWYGPKSILNIDGNQAPDKVSKAIEAALQPFMAGV